MLLKKNKVQIIKGEAFFNDTHQLRVIDGDDAQTYTSRKCYFSNRKSSIEILGFKFGGRVLDSTGALNLTEVPKKLVVIGGAILVVNLQGFMQTLAQKLPFLKQRQNSSTI